MKPSSTNMKEFKFTCPYCPFKAQRQRILTKHEACHNRTPAAKYPCPLCSYSTPNLGKLNDHVMLHPRKTSKGNNNSGDHHENFDSTDIEYDGSRTRKDEQGILLYQSVDDNSRINQSEAAPPKRKAEIWHIYPNGQRKRRKLCDDCDFDTLHQSSLDRHIELWHSITATTAAGTTTRKETLNNIEEHPNADQDDGILPVVLNDIEERRVSLHEVQSSPAGAVGNPEYMEQIPFEDPDQTADVNEPEDGNILSLRSRLVFMKEKARSAEEEMDAIFSKKVEIRNKINEMTETRVYEELNLRFQQRTLLEICISAHDAGEDHRTSTQSMVELVRRLENDMDELDGQLDALKEEENSLAEELEFAQGSHLGVVEVIDALYSELDGRLLNCN